MTVQISYYSYRFSFLILNSTEHVQDNVESAKVVERSALSTKWRISTNYNIACNSTVHSKSERWPTVPSSMIQMMVTSKWWVSLVSCRCCHADLY